MEKEHLLTTNSRNQRIMKDQRFQHFNPWPRPKNARARYPSPNSKSQLTTWTCCWIQTLSISRRSVASILILYLKATSLFLIESLTIARRVWRTTTKTHTSQTHQVWCKRHLSEEVPLISSHSYIYRTVMPLHNSDWINTSLT